MEVFVLEKWSEMQCWLMVQYNFLKNDYGCIGYFPSFVSKTEQCMVVANPEENIYKYGTENIPKDDVVEVQLPYAMKLLLHEMMAMGIDPRIVV